MAERTGAGQDGTIPQRWPRWTPPDLLEWLHRERTKPLNLPFDPIVVQDPRMQPVWEWYTQIKWRKTHSYPESTMRIFRTSLNFCVKIDRAARLPGKPKNMPPKERAAYLSKVRDHAEALINLLNGTSFDNGDTGEVIEEDEQVKSVMNHLRPRGDDDDGHVVAFWVDSLELSRMPFDYPSSHLVDSLHELVAWTKEDDDLDIRSNSPVVHARSRGARAIYFTCILHAELERHGASIPFALLATTANVALKLEADEMLDEDSARKQVRRYEARIAKSAARDSSQDTPQQRQFTDIDEFLL